VTSEPRPDPKPGFTGLEWTQALMEGPGRYQAAVASETLRQLNAPILDALARQQEFAESLAATAEQIGRVAAQVEELARQHSALSKSLRDALGPYLRYVDLLRDVGSGGA
jgi:ABC-type transporter Mla subunit MlaD